jgi:hypothetical protein
MCIVQVVKPDPKKGRFQLSGRQGRRSWGICKVSLGPALLSRSMPCEQLTLRANLLNVKFGQLPGCCMLLGRPEIGRLQGVEKYNMAGPNKTFLDPQDAP